MCNPPCPASPHPTRTHTKCIEPYATTSPAACAHALIPGKLSSLRQCRHKGGEEHGKQSAAERRGAGAAGGVSGRRPAVACPRQAHRGAQHHAQVVGVRDVVPTAGGGDGWVGGVWCLVSALGRLSKETYTPLKAHPPRPVKTPAPASYSRVRSHACRHVVPARGNHARARVVACVAARACEAAVHGAVVGEDGLG